HKDYSRRSVISNWLAEFLRLQFESATSRRFSCRLTRMKKPGIGSCNMAAFSARPAVGFILRFWLAFVVGLLPTAALAQIPYPNPINHVILIDQENRTVDNLLGSNSPLHQFYLPGLVSS